MRLSQLCRSCYADQVVVTPAAHPSVAHKSLVKKAGTHETVVCKGVVQEAFLHRTQVIRRWFGIVLLQLFLLCSFAGTEHALHDGGISVIVIAMQAGDLHHVCIIR